MMIIVWLLIAYLIYQIMTRNDLTIFADRKNASSESTPVEILKLRYVNGEIDEETYKKMISNIK